MGDRYVTVEDAGSQTRRDLEELIEQVRYALQRTEEALLETQRGVPTAAEDYDSAVGNHASCVCVCVCVCAGYCERMR